MVLMDRLKYKYPGARTEIISFAVVVVENVLSFHIFHSLTIVEMLVLPVLLCVGFAPLFMSAPAPEPQLTGEIRSYHQIGDQIKGEYSRLHPDGSVTKTLAFGDTKQGLQYKTYQMDPLGNVKTVDLPNQPGTTSLNPASQTQPQTQPQTQTQPQAQLNQAQPAAQTSGQTAPQTPGINWFLQQPFLDPFNTNSWAPNNPFLQTPAQDPLLAAPPNVNNPLLNWFNI